MFRKIRRAEREIGIDKANEILCNADYGVLSVIGDNGYPYGVPVNYAYVDGKLYFHSTSRGSHILRRRSRRTHEGKMRQSLCGKWHKERQTTKIGQEG